MAQDTYAVTHVMVDIETLGTAPGSAILSIGAVVFDPFAEELGQTFEANIDLASCFAAGLSADPNTLIWWMEQSDAARRAAFLADDEVNLRDGLVGLVDYLGQVARHKGLGLRLWSHGANFDPILLEAAYRAIQHETPWQFRDVRDTRTIFDLAGIGSLSGYRCATDVPHQALSDAKVQARAVMETYRVLGLDKRAA